MPYADPDLNKRIGAKNWGADVIGVQKPPPQPPIKLGDFSGVSAALGPAAKPAIGPAAGIGDFSNIDAAVKSMQEASALSNVQKSSSVYANRRVTPAPAPSVGGAAGDFAGVAEAFNPTAPPLKPGMPSRGGGMTLPNMPRVQPAPNVVGSATNAASADVAAAMRSYAYPSAARPSAPVGVPRAPATRAIGISGAGGLAKAGAAGLGLAAVANPEIVPGLIERPESVVTGPLGALGSLPGNASMAAERIMRGQVPAGELGGAVYDNTIRMPIDAAYNVGSSLGGLIRSTYDPAYRQQFGENLQRGGQVLGQSMNRLADRMFGPQSPALPASVSAAQPSSSIGGMTADQMNAEFSRLGIGGVPASPAPASAPVGVQATAASPTPAVATAASQQPPMLDDWSLRQSSTDIRPNQFLPFSMRHSPNVDPRMWAAATQAAIEQARINAGMITADKEITARATPTPYEQARTEAIRNEMSGQVTPERLAEAAMRTDDPAAYIGAMQSAGIGINPGERPMQIGLPTYMAQRYPSVARLGDMQSPTIDDVRGAYTQASSGITDAELAQLQEYFRSILARGFSPEEITSAGQPGWFGLGSEGANANRDWLNSIGYGY